MFRLLTIVAVLATVTAGAPAHSGEMAALQPPATLKVDWVVDGSITAVAVAAWGISSAFDNQTAPSKCRWCGTDALDAHVRNALVWSNPKAADTTSTVIAITASLGIAGYSFLDGYVADGTVEAGENMVLIAEAVGLTGVLTQIAKHATGRSRPYVYYGGGKGDPQGQLSFWSGHSAEVFSTVAAAGTVARLRGYEDWPWIYAVGFTCAASMAYFRMAGDKHWLTDVLTGSTVGTTVGFLVPWLHSSGSEQRSFRVVPTSNGLALAGEF